MSPRSRVSPARPWKSAPAAASGRDPGARAKLELRAARVRLAAPRAAENPEPVVMLAVSATESDPPAGKAPLNWLLLSSERSADAETAHTVVTWYERRWTVEEYFRVLKTGTRVEDRKLEHADDLRKCLAFDAITACYVFDLERMAPRPIRSSTTTKSSSTSG